MNDHGCIVVQGYGRSVHQRLFFTIPNGVYSGNVNAIGVTGCSTKAPDLNCRTCFPFEYMPLER